MKKRDRLNIFNSRDVTRFVTLKDIGMALILGITVFIVRILVLWYNTD